MEYPPLTRDDLIAIRDGNKRNKDVRALLREIKRQHDIILQVEQVRQSIDKAWKEETHSQLAGLHTLRNLLQPELGRFPSDVRLASVVPKKE